MLNKIPNTRNISARYMVYVLVLLTNLYSGTVFAIESGMVDIRPYVSATTMYDDNIFRFANATQAKTAFGTTDMSDTMTSLNAGVNVGVRLSRQQLNFGLGLSDNKFDRFKNLDYMGNNASAAWAWQLGNHFNGVLSYSESESAPGFAESVSKAKNLRTSTNYLASLNWQFHPSWLAFVSISQTESLNSGIDSKTLNNEIDKIETGVQYESPASTKIRLYLSDSEVSTPNRTGVSLQQFGDKNNQRQLITNASWAPTLLTKLNLIFALVDLEYPGHSNRDFSGTSQSLILDYALTSNTNLGFSVFKEVTGIQDLVSTYVESTGFSVRPSWQVTSKVSVGGGLEYRDRNYLGSAGVFSSAAVQRQDQNRYINLFLNYKLTRQMTILTSYSNERRSSNINTFDITDNILNATLRYEFFK